MRRLEPEPAEVHDVAAFVAAASRPSPADRPWVLVNMIASLDGSIFMARVSEWRAPASCKNSAAR